MASPTTRDVLQNQDRFTAPAYRDRVAPLADVLRASPLARVLVPLRRSAVAAGAMMFARRRRFRTAVTVGHRAAFAYGALRRLFGAGGARHVAKEFYFEERAGAVAWLRRAAYRWALRDLDALVVNASGERAAYAALFGLPPDRVAFLAWPSNIDDPRRVREHDGSVLAVGRSLRDWPTFFRAVAGLPRRVVVVASAADVAGLGVPANVTVRTDVPRAEYLELLHRAMAVAVPLVATQRSTGQATFLEAMALGKPVVAAEVVGSVDYLTDGESALLYPPGDAAALRRCLDRLGGDEALRDRLAEGGLRAVRGRFNKHEYARGMLAVIDGEW